MGFFHQSTLIGGSRFQTLGSAYFGKKPSPNFHEIPWFIPDQSDDDSKTEFQTTS
jgi:hypothetical protein